MKIAPASYLAGGHAHVAMDILPASLAYQAVVLCP
jgi:hypothetical protein